MLGYCENKWTYLPDMIEERYFHASVSIGNKLFIIAGNSRSCSEVFYSYSRKIILISSIDTNIFDKFNFQATSVGNKILVFYYWNYSPRVTNVFIYDVINDCWSEKEIDVLKSLICSSYIRYNSGCN